MSWLWVACGGAIGATMRCQQRHERNHRKQEAVQYHVREIHLGKSDLAEEESTAPKGAGKRAREKTGVTFAGKNWHTSTLAQKRAGTAPKPCPLPPRAVSYQTRQLLSGTIDAPFLQLKAAANPG